MAFQVDVDQDLHARLIAAAAEGGGVATWAILLEQAEANATTGKQQAAPKPKVENTDIGFPRPKASNEEAVIIVHDSDDDLGTGNIRIPTSKRARGRGQRTKAPQQPNDIKDESSSDHIPTSKRARGRGTRVRAPRQPQVDENDSSLDDIPDLSNLTHGRGRRSNPPQHSQDIKNDASSDELPLPRAPRPHRRHLNRQAKADSSADEFVPPNSTPSSAQQLPSASPPSPASQQQPPGPIVHPSVNNVKYVFREYATGASPAHDIDFEAMVLLNVSTWMIDPNTQQFRETSNCPMCFHQRYKSIPGGRRPKWPQQHVDCRSFAFHFLRPDHHREFSQWEKIVMLGLTIRRCPGVWDRLYDFIGQNSARPMYEEDLDMGRIADLMINKQKVRRDFMSFANGAAGNLRANKIVFPSCYTTG